MIGSSVWIGAFKRSNDDEDENINKYDFFFKHIGYMLPH